MRNPCIGCGACCAFFRVAFHWSETDPALGGIVPGELTAKLDPHRVAMQGTDQAAPRCVALVGDIGGTIGCSIYAQRPSVCRELQPAWLEGVPSPQCDRARIAHGLAPLTPEYWNEAPSGAA